MNRAAEELESARVRTFAYDINRPVVAVSPRPDNRGYWLVASDGGVSAFDAPFLGSMCGTSLANTPPTAPIVGVAAFTTT